MVNVKICGLRTEKEIQTLNGALPAYAGFVFATSKRQMEPDHAAVLIRKMNRLIKPVGVFMNQDIPDIVKAVNLCGLKVAQLHGDEDGKFIRSLRTYLPDGIHIWKALRVGEPLSDNYDLLATRISAYSALCEMILLDSCTPGGGKPFDYNCLPSFSYPLALAGGLTPETVAIAIRKLNPVLVDVSSGVEGPDGYKDEGRIKAFIIAVREANL